MTFPFKIIGNMHILRTDGMNFNFNRRTGRTITWGNTINDNPDFCPFGPMIADIEVTTICKGPGGRLCPFCYKSNTAQGENMSFDTFKEIIDKMPNTITQVALGADAQCESNPDIWKMMAYCREKSIVPNITVADISNDTADKLAGICGAVAVSRYADKNYCYNSIKKLVDRGMNQVNMHFMVHEDNFNEALETIKDYHTDYRLAGMNAIVFLSLKKKGRGEKYKPMSQLMFTQLVHETMKHKVPFGFDSCSTPKFLKAIKIINEHFKNIGLADEVVSYERMEQMAEPCESTLFSIYFNEKGEYFPCSFCEDKFEGIHISGVDSIYELWHSAPVELFRQALVNNTNDMGVRCCPVYNI